jgi:hypothetical protein
MSPDLLGVCPKSRVLLSYFGMDLESALVKPEQL